MTNSGKNLEIEYLRAIAVLLTCLSHVPILMPYHAQALTPIFFGFFTTWTGVDLFFCISGFVVSKSFIDLVDKHKSEGNFWLAAQSFWIRRFYRLTPSAWLWVAVGIVCVLTFNSTGTFGTLYQNLRSATAVITLTGNLANLYGMLAPNGVYWSLALEEQFYLCFPLFLLVVPAAWRWRILLLCIALQFPVERNPFGTPLATLAWNFRLDALMWGILIYLFSKSSQYRLFEPTFLKNSKVKTLVINLLLIYLLGAIAGQMLALPIAVGLVAMVSALLVLMASYQSGYICNIPFLSGVLAWLGARSYAIYLIHLPAFRFCFEAWTRYAIRINHPLDDTFTLRMSLSAIVLTLVLAELNFRLVEEPLRKIGAAIASRRLAQAQHSI